MATFKLQRVFSKSIDSEGNRVFRAPRKLYSSVTDNLTQPVAAVGNTVANTANRTVGGAVGAVSGAAKGLGELAKNPIKTAIGVAAAPLTGGLSLIPAAGKVAGSTLQGVGEGLEKGV